MLTTPKSFRIFTVAHAAAVDVGCWRRCCCYCCCWYRCCYFAHTRFVPIEPRSMNARVRFRFDCAIDTFYSLLLLFIQSSRFSSFNSVGKLNYCYFEYDGPCTRSHQYQIYNRSNEKRKWNMELETEFWMKIKLKNTMNGGQFGVTIS